MNEENTNQGDTSNPDANGLSHPLQPIKQPSKRDIYIKKNLVYAIIIVVVIIMGFTVIMAKLINENSQCTTNPFIYGASKIKSTGGEIAPFCTCQLGEGVAIWFDDEQVYTKNPLFTGHDEQVYTKNPLFTGQIAIEKP